ncbi:MAG: hypothetical protein BroJett011_46650 [Chloroflexota bacterium]|nr:MAG: hypothetical protein BroJett011_46650 [Chloroflexota bacterium]
MSTSEQYVEASLKTAGDLRTIARSILVRDVSRLSLPEIDTVVESVAQVIPAGNIPGVILNGLARLSGRKPPLPTVRRDINLLFKGVEQVLDKAVYTTFFAGPAAVIWGYQNLLKLAGKDPDDSFPEGTWQFYVDYALREDTARHANETHGFDTTLNQHQLRLNDVDRITAWVMAAIHCLHQYPHILENEWRERVYTYLLAEITAAEPHADRYAHLYREWEKQRPYGRGPDTEARDTYAIYRRRKFDHFLNQALRDLPAELRREWEQRVRTAEENDLPAYQQQISILAYLAPGPYGETRTAIPLAQAHIGIIHRGHYYLIPACQPGTEQPADLPSVRAQIAALAAGSGSTSPVLLSSLAETRRAEWPQLRAKFSPALIQDLDSLRLAPILLNSERRPRQLSLAELRRAERGVGDHPLTLFDTGETVVFDQSHIFFDGAWGAALAEIMTKEALAWAVYLSTLPPAQPGPISSQALTFPISAAELTLIGATPRVMPEVSAETEAVQLKAILALRRLFKRRNDLIELTVNDLLVLYRAIHAATYQPSAALVDSLKQLAQGTSTRAAALAALEALDSSKQLNPTILIPVDASQRAPRDRLYPMTFEAPLKDLDLLNLHQQVVTALETYQQAAGDRTELYARFDQLQRAYLAMLAGFGQVLGKAKGIALQGESASIGALKLLAHLPTPLQRMLDQVPSRIDILNDLIKGREAFSNVGAVAPTSTLTRFITAKDDNDKKTLVWGVITDAKGIMRITLRDFRPHVGLLEAAGQHELAVHLTKDYLEAYALGLNNFIRDLHRITETSRETRLARSGER